MKFKILLPILTLIFFGFVTSSTVFAQDTFGPICEQGLTCTPALTSAPHPTLPVTGPMGSTYALFGLGALLLFAGVASFLSLRFVRD
jgi:hypothetical protein